MPRHVTTRLLILAFTLVAYSGIPDPGPVEIRVRNVSSERMDDVVVTFPDGPVDYGDIDPGAASSYRTVDRAYRYAAVAAVADGDSLAITPVDYVGESLLAGGAYTYRIGLSDAQSLTLELVRD